MFKKLLIVKINWIIYQFLEHYLRNPADLKKKLSSILATKKIAMDRAHQKSLPNLI